MTGITADGNSFESDDVTGFETVKEAIQSVKEAYREK